MNYLSANFTLNVVRKFNRKFKELGIMHEVDFIILPHAESWI